MNIIEAKLNEIVNSLFADVISWFGYNQPISVTVSLTVIITGIIIILIVFASAFWSAQLAEMDRKKRFTHFLVGLFIPWMYPLIIYKAINTSSKSVDDTIIVEQKEEMTENEKIAKLFAKIAIDENGEPQGPFIFNLTDNTALKVNLITEVKDSLIVVEAITSEGERQKLRVPFSYIKSYSKI